MATHEHVVLHTFKDQNGDNHLLYPITKTDCIDGLEEFVDQAISEAGVSGGTSGENNADWSVNDPDAPGYVKNRTHYEVPPAYDIRWDGDMTDRFALDLSQFGYSEGTYYVKVSDLVISVDEAIGGETLISSDEFSSTITESDIDTSSFPGAYTIGQVIVVTDQEVLNTALGLPDGYVTNGVYFYIDTTVGAYTSMFIGSSAIFKIDEKYLPEIPSSVVKYVSQDLSDEEKSIAQANIGVLSDTVTVTKSNLMRFMSGSLRPGIADEKSWVHEINSDIITYVSPGACRNNDSLYTVVLPKAISIDDDAFNGCNILDTVDLSSVEYIGSGVFSSCINLVTVILRMNAVPELYNIDAFTYTPIVNGTGYIYVPAKMIDSYKTATNWSTYANQFRAIEDYPDICGVPDETRVDVVFYSNLSTAITDINNGVTDNAITDTASANVKVFTSDNGAQTVMLLNDVTESVQISISRDIHLVLAGHTLSFTESTAYLLFAADTDCVVDGTVSGSAIYKNVTASGTINLIRDDGKKLIVRGGTYTLTGPTATALPFRIYTEEFEMYDATVICETAASGTNSRAFQTNTKAKIERCTITATGAKNPVAFYVSGGDAIVTGSTISVSSTANGAADAYGIRLTSAAGELMVDGTDITVTSDASANGIKRASVKTVYVTNTNISVTSTAAIDSTARTVHGIGSDTVGEVYISNSSIFTDARGGHADQPHSVGIQNYGTLFCKDTDVTGTHSGISNSTGGQLYVSGGILTGTTHGGLYLAHGADGVAYIRDATLRCGGYTGQFTDFMTSGNNYVYASMYVGSASNNIAYLDGCTINDTNCGGHAFVLRSSDGETGHQVYISNSTATMNVRIDSDTSKLYVGMGTNLTESMIVDSEGVQQSQRAEFTNELYRRHEGSEELSGKDFEAQTLAIAEGSGSSLPEVTASDAGKFLRVSDAGIWTAVAIANAEGVSF